MAEKIVAIFVACSMDLLICVDLPVNETQHVFLDTDMCQEAIVEIVAQETGYRKKYHLPYPVVMGKCVWWLDERHIR